MLHDEEFSSRAKVDRYGRKLPKNSGKRELEKFYRIADENGKIEDNDDSGSESEHLSAQNEELSLPSSSEETSSGEEETDEPEEDEVFGFPEENGVDGGIPMGKPSSRLAVVNLDWDNIRATDLLAVFSSFTPNNGQILKVSVFPSEFGKERMDREEIEGPPIEIFRGKPEILNENAVSESERDDEDADGADEDERIKNSLLKEDQGQEFNSAKLRRYQLERLRYYYAVLICSSTAVAQAIYNAVDGTEYLTTANFFDLRFIPDDVDFSHDKPRDECESIPDSYRPNEFVTDALQHSKVRLTWDADDGTRKEAQKRAFTGSRADIDENDLKAYLGSDSSDDERPAPTVSYTNSEFIADGSRSGDIANEPDQQSSKKEIERQKMRESLGLGKEPATSKRSKAEIAPTGDMQITFSSGLSSEPKNGSVFENEPERNETTVEKYVRKERERKSRRKEKMKNNRNAASETLEPATTNTQPTPKPHTTSPPPPSTTLGFSDPFFTNPSPKPHPKPKPPPPHSSTPQSPSPSPTPPSPTPHFSMPEIELAEKLHRKPHLPRRRKLSRRQQAALAAAPQQQQQRGDDGVTGVFKVDVDDPRFGAVFDQSEFAIDPLHRGFRGTEGMRMILEEGRRRREEGRGGKRERGGVGDGDGEVVRLVKRVKAKGI